MFQYHNRCPECGIKIKTANTLFCGRCGSNLLRAHLIDRENMDNGTISNAVPTNWIVSYAVNISEMSSNLHKDLSCVEMCDHFESWLVSKVCKILTNGEQVESERDGESLGIRFSFSVGRYEDLANIPQIPPFEITEVLPYNDVYDANS